MVCETEVRPEEERQLSQSWSHDRSVHLPESLLAPHKLKYVSATSLPISGGRVPGEARETRRGTERLENQEKTSEQDAKKRRPKATDFSRSPVWTCDDHHPNFSPTFNFRVGEIQKLQLHEVPDLWWNGSWQVVGSADAVGGRKRRKNK